MSTFIWLSVLFSLLLACFSCTSTPPSTNRPSAIAHQLSSNRPSASPKVHFVLDAAQAPKNCRYLNDYSLDTDDEKFKEWISEVTQREGGNYFIVDKMWLEGQIYVCPEGNKEKSVQKRNQKNARK